METRDHRGKEVRRKRVNRVDDEREERKEKRRNSISKPIER